MIKLALFVVVLLQGVLSAMTKEEILKLAAEKHDDANLVEELKIFPRGREYKMTYTVIFPKYAFKIPEQIAKEKIVQGKYIVTEFTIPSQKAEDGKTQITMVTTFDKEGNCYKKWVINSELDLVRESTGMLGVDKKTISWVGLSELKEGGYVHIANETYTKNSAKWVEHYIKNGKLEVSMEGVATKVK